MLLNKNTNIEYKKENKENKENINLKNSKNKINYKNKKDKKILNYTEENNINKTKNNEDITNIHIDNIKKMDENSLNKLKIKLNTEYRAMLYENQINNDKILLYKKLIEEYKTNVSDGFDEKGNIINLNNYISIRNSILEKVKFLFIV